MIGLRALLSGAFPKLVASDAWPDIPVTGLECDSRRVEKGFVFVAVRGAKQNGTAFIDEALRRGAVAIVAEEAVPVPASIPLIHIKDSRQAIARLAAEYYGRPADGLRLIGVTGTNGKTTTAYLIEHLMNSQKISCGLLGTILHRYGGSETTASETTPGPLKLQEIFSKMKQARCTHAVMEVSSHALDQKRVETLAFECAVFTNFTQDHLDYHGDLATYFTAKAKLFEGLSERAFAILNADDDRVMTIAQRTRANIVTFSTAKNADLKAENIRYGVDMTMFDLVVKSGRSAVTLPLVGAHNVSNALAALAAVVSMGLDLKQAVDALATFEGVPGRLEQVRCGQNFAVLVDFAHTPDGLEKVLNSLKAAKKGRLILLFGCGGDRDKKKRPIMGQIAARLADQVFVTSDNPRSEDPKVIANEICEGFPHDFKNFRVVLDRTKAIREALMNARIHDIVLLAGKGHERAQIIGDRSIPFSDKAEAERMLNGR